MFIYVLLGVHLFKEMLMFYYSNAFLFFICLNKKQSFSNYVAFKRSNLGLGHLSKKKLGFGCCSGEILKFDGLVPEILSIALPAALALAADPITSLVDTAFVGHIGKKCWYLFFLYGSVISLFLQCE